MSHKASVWIGSKFVDLVYERCFKMEKVLMLGSDYGSCEIIKELHNRGFWVIVADYYETTSAKKIADESWLVSTNDYDTLEKKCRDNSVVAVITGASDFNGGNLRVLCKRLGLPVYCQNDSAWQAATNKYVFKQLCKSVGAPVAEDYDVEEYLQDKANYNIVYPVVIKPVDMSANRGMSYCYNEAEVECAIGKARSFSQNPHLIMERKLEGPEFAVNYIVADGEPRLFFFSSEHHQPGELANLYSIITTTNYHLNQYISEVNDKVIEVFKKAKLTNGVAWVECMLDKDSHFYLLEMGYRFGGEVVNIPYKDISGFDSINWMIDCELGIEHKVTELPAEKYNYKGCATAYMLFATHSGVVSEINGIDKISKLDGVKIDITKEVGKSVKQYMTLGVIRISSESCEALCNKLQIINSNLKIKDQDGKNLLLQFDNYRELLDEYDMGVKEMM